MGGGSSGPGIGNGRAIALRFAAEGADVTVVDRDIDAAQETVGQVRDAGGTASAAGADVTNAAACAGVMASLEERHGGIDTLVFNVGVTGPSTTVPHLDEDDWDLVMRVNAKGAMLAAKHAIPVMRPGGSIVNISSIGAIRTSERPAYAASKGAVTSLTIAMAGQHGPQGIRDTAIPPATVCTPLDAAAATDSEAVEDLRRRRAESTLLKTEGTPWDVANAAVFLASDEARWITGHLLVVDGGASISRLAWRPPVAH
jgi:NAD(P)-dependent dehydrogenase (short-subunit alcohol dehydrogenase family)